MIISGRLLEFSLLLTLYRTKNLMDTASSADIYIDSDSVADMCMMAVDMDHWAEKVTYHSNF
jgi:hypothetical protein